MSSLAFLSPDSTEVAARTPMHRLALKAGARFETRDGWEVATGYDGGGYPDTVGFADRSQLVKLELHGPPGVVLQPGVATQLDRSWWCPITPSRTLLLGGPPVRHAPIPGADVVELTSALAALALIGPKANELLARFCAIDVRPQMMPVAAFRPGSVARTPGYVLRAAEDELLILVGWALGAYLWEVVADAAEHLGGGPVA
jgi:glycine cleavage system aminomethyltransferase T